MGSGPEPRVPREAGLDGPVPSAVGAAAVTQSLELPARASTRPQTAARADTRRVSFEGLPRKGQGGRPRPASARRAAAARGWPVAAIEGDPGSSVGYQDKITALEEQIQRLQSDVEHAREDLQPKVEQIKPGARGEGPGRPADDGHIRNPAVYRAQTAPAPQSILRYGAQSEEDLESGLEGAAALEAWAAAEDRDEGPTDEDGAGEPSAAREDMSEEVRLLADHLAELANFTAEDELVGTGQFDEARFLTNLLREVGGSPSCRSSGTEMGHEGGGEREEERHGGEKEGRDALSSPGNQGNPLTESMEDFSWMDAYRSSRDDLQYADLLNSALFQNLLGQAPGGPEEGTNAREEESLDDGGGEDGGGSEEPQQETAWRMLRPRQVESGRRPGHGGCVHYMGLGNLHGDSRPKPASGYHRATKVKAFSFDQRDQNKRKTISQVKLEQELALKAVEEEEACRVRFKANPLPRATLQPRYEKLTREQAARTRENKRRSQENLKKAEKPFSFYFTDKERKAAREEKLERARNKKADSFKANPIPASVHESRFELLQFDRERRKGEAREKAAKALAKASLPERMKNAAPKKVPAYDTSKPYSQYKLGEVPDFDALHADFDSKLARMRARNRRQLTVPKDFHLGGRNKAEAEARQRKSELKKQMILLDMELDKQDLPETRWPYKGTRSPTKPTPPPAAQAPVEYKTTTAARLREKNVKAAKAAGQYDSREQKEAKAEKQRRREASRRMAEWLKLQRKRAQEGVPGAGSPGPARSGERDFADAVGIPRMHVAARHKQVADEAHKIVEQALLEQGLDAFKYYDG